MTKILLKKARMKTEICNDIGCADVNCPKCNPKLKPMTKNQFKEHVFKELEKIILVDSIMAVNSTPEVGEVFDLEKLNYTNARLNELNGFIWDKCKPLFSQSLDEIVELVFRECERDKKVINYQNMLANEEQRSIGFNSCIDERSKLENKFLE